MGQYDVVELTKPGGCCRHRFWGWKQMEKHDLGTSALGWGRFTRVWALMIVRLLFALYALAVLIWGLVQLQGRYPTNGSSPSAWWSWGIYLGNWALFSNMLYFLTGTFFSIREIHQGAFGVTNWFEKWMWVNYEIAWSLTWSVTLGFWLIANTDCTFNHNCSGIGPYEWHIYGISLIWLLVEVLFNLMRFKWLHVIFPVIFLVVYFIVSAIWHGATGVWPQPQQDSTIVSAAGAFYPVLLLLVVGFHMCGYGCGWVMEKCWKKGQRTTEGDLYGDDPVQINECCDC